MRGSVRDERTNGARCRPDVASVASFSVDGDDKRDLVRRGYDALSYHYRSDDADDGRYALWLADLHQRLPISAAVLDLGCGCGVPVARFLANAGHRVTGVDISDVQIERARRLVPTGTFRRADATQIDLRLRRSTPSTASTHSSTCLWPTSPVLSIGSPPGYAPVVGCSPLSATPLGPEQRTAGLVAPAMWWSHGADVRRGRGLLPDQTSTAMPS
jgi:Methyltransferase domain